MPDPYDENMLLGYIEGELSPDEAARVEQLMREDARLRHLIAELVRDRRHLRQMPDESAPPELMQRIQQQLERDMLLAAPPPEVHHRSRTARRFRIGRLAAYSGLAAMILFSAGIMIHTLVGTTEPATVGPPTPGLAGDRIALEHMRELNEQGLEAAQDRLANASSAEGDIEFAAARADQPAPAAPGAAADSLMAAKPTGELAMRTAAEPTTAAAEPLETYARLLPRKALRSTGGIAAGLAQSEPQAVQAQTLALDTAGARRKEMPTTGPILPTPSAAGHRVSQPDRDETFLAFTLKATGKVQRVVTSADSPSLQINSTDPDLSLKDVLAWARDNDAEVITAHAVVEDSKQSRQVVLMIQPRQLPHLVDHLNHFRGRDRQRAQIVRDLTWQDRVTRVNGLLAETKIVVGLEDERVDRRSADHENRSRIEVLKKLQRQRGDRSAAVWATNWGLLLETQLPFEAAAPVYDLDIAEAGGGASGGGLLLPVRIQVNQATGDQP